MNFVLISLVVLASMLMVAYGDDDLHHCDAMSQSFGVLGARFWPNKIKAALEYIKENCPSQDLLTHIGYVKQAQQQQGGFAPKRQYKIDLELKHEQTRWLEAAEDKVSDYFFELAEILDEPEKLTGEAIEYPSSEAIDHLLKEVDEDDDGSFKNVTMTYFWSHTMDPGIVKLLYVMHKAQEHKKSR